MVGLGAQSCAANSTAPPKSSSSGSCCGSYRQQGSAMPSSDITVMMRAIDVVSLSRNKALLWTVPLGKGHLIATGLKLLASDEHGAAAEAAPEQAWVLDRLLRYGESLLGDGAR